MKLSLHRGGAETAERDAQCQPSLRWSQRSLSLRGEVTSKKGSWLLRLLRGSSLSLDWCTVHSHAEPGALPRPEFYRTRWRDPSSACVRADKHEVGGTPPLRGAAHSFNGFSRGESRSGAASRHRKNRWL